MSARREARFGIGEWYGRPFTELSAEERRRFAEIQFMPRNERPVQACPFLSSGRATVACSKEGGVCSIRKYERSVDTGEVSVAPDGGTLRTTCPNRFEQDGEIYRWIGEVVLNRRDAMPIGQVNFLQRVSDDPVGKEGVGRIDNILLVPDTNPLQWCAVEIQAVYFSGGSMKRDFERILEAEDELQFPAAHRRPDYRSSGPKRLMPQLQIKVPTLSRWGKKMAVVVDAEFFRAMGPMRTVDELTNCDVAWFVVAYDDGLSLKRDNVYLTTLEQSVQGLIAGFPVSLSQFEERVLNRLSRLRLGPTEIPSDQ